MDYQDVKSMSDTDLTIKIAEKLGWKHDRAYYSDRYHYRWVLNSLPQYSTDLNAMHEAEKILEKQQLNDYCLWLLHEVCKGKTVLATAREKAEAFILATECNFDEDFQE